MNSLRIRPHMHALHVISFASQPRQPGGPDSLGAQTAWGPSTFEGGRCKHGWLVSQAKQFAAANHNIVHIIEISHSGKLARLGNTNPIKWQDSEHSRSRILITWNAIPLMINSRLLSHCG